MMRTLIVALLALMTALAPSALAQEDEKREEPATNDSSENAWVEDCPPGMMCAMEQPPADAPQQDNASADEPTYSGDCGGEVCAYGQQPSEPVQSDDGSTCMDGQQEGETCDDNVYYMDGPGRETPADEAATTGVVSGGARSNDVPAPALAMGILAFAAVAVLALPRRQN